MDMCLGLKYAALHNTSLGYVPFKNCNTTQLLQYNIASQFYTSI